MNNRLESKDYKSIALELGLPVTEVRRAVQSFFGDIVQEVRRYPFDDPKRIYSKDMFESIVGVWNIPFIGRLGPAYSKYLSWRKNEAKTIEQEARSNYKSRITQDDIENMAGEILSGVAPSPVRKKKFNELYNRVWLVGRNGKTLARQVIPKKNENV